MELAFESVGQVLEHFRNLGGRDVLAKTQDFTVPADLRAMGMNPYFVPLERNDGPEAILDGKRVLMFGSNNYLGLTHDERVKQAVKDVIDTHGTSFTGSRLLNGTTSLHEEVERNLADFLGKESALVFATGYQTNIGVFSALINRNTTAVIDNRSHASIHDGIAVAQGEKVAFPHGDMEALDAALEQCQTDDHGCLVATDGLFSMHGNVAPLDEIVPIVRKHGARLLVDDAHGVGTIGPGGRGTGARFGLQDDVDIVVGTFSKSLSSIGGFVAGDHQTMEYVKHFGSSMLFSASLAPPNLAAANAALEILKAEPERVDRVNALAAKWRNGLQEMGYTTEGDSPIVPVIIGDDFKAFEMWKRLLAEGVYVNCAVYPSVPRGGALLRTSLMATHTDEQVEEALGIFERVGKSAGVL